MTVAILFISFFILMFIGVPIAISLGISSLATIMFATSLPTSTFVQKAFASLDSFPLLAIPFFILAGVIMTEGGMSKRLLDLASVLVGYLVGGLAMVSVVASMFFAALSGSGPATVAAVGSIMIPSMKERNYSEGFAAAVTAASGSLGVLIPPSIPLVMYGIVSGVSIGALFLAGIIPGLIMGILIMISAYIISKKNNYVGVGKRPTFKELISAINNAKFGLLVPVIILGGIYGGIFSPTESAAVAAVYALIIGMFVYKTLNLKSLYRCFASAALTNAVSTIILGLSISFAYLLTIERIPQVISNFITNISENPIIILLFINLFLLVVGMFIETLPAIIVLTPILLPVVTELGMDPLHFGIIIVANLAIGFVTPPLGVNLMIASGVGKVPFDVITRAVVPFVVVMIISLLIITYVPQVSTFIPEFL